MYGLEMVSGTVTVVGAQTTNDDHFREESRIEWRRLFLKGTIGPQVGNEGLKQ